MLAAGTDLLQAVTALPAKLHAFRNLALALRAFRHEWLSFRCSISHHISQIHLDIHAHIDIQRNRRFSLLPITRDRRIPPCPNYLL